MSNTIYQKAFSNNAIGFTFKLVTQETGRVIGVIVRSDKPESELYDIIVTDDYPVECRVAHVGDHTLVTLDRRQP